MQKTISKTKKSLTALHFLLAALCCVLLFSFNVSAEIISGTIVETVVDFPDGSSREELTLVDDKGVPYLLKFISTRSTQQIKSLENGSRVTIDGEFGSTNSISVSNIISQSKVRTKGNDAITGIRTSLTILVNLSDASAETANCNKSLIADRMYTTVSGNFEKSSYGLLSFPGSISEVAGPFTISAPAATCDPYGWAAQADTAATNAGYNLANYQHRVYVLPRYNLIGCSWAGLGNTSCYGFCRSWIALCEAPMVYSHELGHNLGLAHAGTDPEDDGTVNSTYGDHSCPMGNSLSYKHFNAPHKEQSGWLNSDQIKSFTVDTSYNLYALHLDTSNTSGPQAIKFPRGDGTYYYVSYRSNSSQASDYNNGLSTTYNQKVSIHTYAGSGYQVTKHIKSLAAGESYTTVNGYTISVTSIDPNFANISLTSPDTDGDGFTDSVESSYGTDPNDINDYPESLTSPVHILWNSFLRMINIVELVNPGDTTVTATVRLYDIAGQLKDTQVFAIAANSQFDVILNNLNGFVATGSYGLVTVSYTGGMLDGRTSYYRQQSSGSDYEFAYSIPFENTMSGDRVVSFNTYEPAGDVSKQVLNWLTIVNIANLAKNFTINTYNQVGTMIASQSFSIPANGRIDLDGGHGIAGQNMVGFHEILPGDKNSPFIGQLTRYGSSLSMDRYYYAFPLNGVSGLAGTRDLPISNYFGEMNWVELINVSGSVSTATLEAFDLSGNKVSTQNISLAARSQQNIYASGLLPVNNIGFVRIVPNQVGTLTAQSMFYFVSPSNTVTAIYGTQALRSVGARLSGSYNLYINAKNWLRITNTTNAARSILVKIAGVENTISLNPMASQMIAVHDNSSWGTLPNTYGFVSVTPDTFGVFSENIRVRSSSASSSITNFAFSTRMRPQTN